MFAPCAAWAMVKMSSPQLQAAFVIHQRPFRNTSAIVEVFSEQHGRLGLMARGLRAPRSRWRGILQPYQGLVLSWRGRGELPTLIQAEIAGPCCLFQGRRLFSALYLNELLLRLTHRHDPMPELFARYRQALLALQDADEATVLRLFERDLLKHIGYELVLEHTAEGVAVVPGGRYRYRLGHGLVPSQAEQAFSGEALLAFAAGRLDNAASRDCARRLMRQVLAPLLGDKPLHSRLLYADYRRRTARSKI